MEPRFCWNLQPDSPPRKDALVLFAHPPFPTLGRHLVSDRIQVKLFASNSMLVPSDSDFRARGLSSVAFSSNQRSRSTFGRKDREPRLGGTAVYTPINGHSPGGDEGFINVEFRFVLASRPRFLLSFLSLLPPFPRRVLVFTDARTDPLPLCYCRIDIASNSGGMLSSGKRE